MTLDDLRKAAELLPPGASLILPREAVLGAIASQPAPVSVESSTWREKLWTCPAETRLGVREVAEALDRPTTFVYRAVAKSKGAHRLPSTRFGGELAFTAGEVRDWIERESEAA